MSRTVKAPDVRRSELIQHAQHLFYSQGYERTSINDIVKAAGVAKGTFYYYFDSKTAVLHAMIQQISQQRRNALKPIINDPTLTAIEKWQQAVQSSQQWKLNRKEEMLNMLHLYAQDDNLRLRYYLQKETTHTRTNSWAKIIAQGVDEGVFHVDSVEETAVIIANMLVTFSETLIDLLINHDKYDQPQIIAEQKITAVQTAIERILGAPPNSLPIADQDTIMAWFTN